MLRTMRRFSLASFRSILGNSFVAGIAASTLLVGVVWTTSFATEGDGVSTDTTMASDIGSTDESLPGDSVPTDSVPTDSIPQENGDGSDNTSTDGTPPATDDLAARVAALETTISELQSLLDQATALVADYQAKTAHLDANGNYTGTIVPRQISPQLKVADITGKWPLVRTEGDLPLARVDIGFSTCRSDSRAYGVITVGSFRRLECVRIPK